MNYFVITDTHFGHDRMLEFCGRPKNFELKILNGLHVVTEKDVLIHLGDFSIGNDEYWHNDFMNHVKGKKWLIRGNHDKKTYTWYLEHGWDFVADAIELNMYGKRILLTHKPVYDLNRYDVNVHGHHHNNQHHPEDVLTNKHRLFYIEHEYNPRKLLDIVIGDWKRTER